MSTLQVGNFTFASQLNILIGNKCTAQCDFCTNESSPKGKLHLSPETCKQLVQQAKALGFESIGFSGGEPFLYRALLLELSEIAYTESLRFVIATNGYWGNNQQEANNLVQQLRAKGLSKLQLSYDVSHARYVKKEAIYSVLNACMSADVPVVLCSAYYPGEQRVRDLLDLSSFDNITVEEGEVLSVGRARNSAGRLNRNTVEISPIGICPKSLQMTVNFDGEVYPCCSVGGFSSELSLGNIATRELGDLSKEILGKTFVYYLQNHDATWIARELGQEADRRFRTVCELCHFIHSNKGLLAKYSSVAEEAMLESFFHNAISQAIT